MIKKLMKRGVVHILDIYGVIKPFIDTCHGHGNIPLTVEISKWLGHITRYIVTTDSNLKT